MCFKTVATFCCSVPKIEIEARLLARLRLVKDFRLAWTIWVVGVYVWWYKNEGILVPVTVATILDKHLQGAHLNIDQVEGCTVSRYHKRIKFWIKAR